jgi:hypothetical protein
MIDPALQVLDGIELVGGAVNTPDDVLLANITANIRRGHPQIKEQLGLQRDAIALVCGGPSLAATLPELYALAADGVKIVTVNGAYQWCIAHHLIPSMQIVMDARAGNARFLDPPLPRCHYLLASQCDPVLFDAVATRPHVWIYHVGINDDTPTTKAVLDGYYLGHWHNVGGGTTVGTRALVLLRTLGFVRFDLFGMDSCWQDDVHHAYAQPENDHDQRLRITAAPAGHPELARVFWCAPWHLQQLQDFLQLVRLHGDAFVLTVHGDGLLAYALTSSADVQLLDDQGAITYG